MLWARNPKPGTRNAEPETNPKSHTPNSKPQELYAEEWALAGAAHARGVLRRAVTPKPCTPLP